MATWHPGEILASSSAYWRSSVVHAAIRLDLFSVIGDERLDVAEVAQRLNASERGVMALLDALAALQLLHKDGKQYHNSDAARTHLVRGEPRYLGDIIHHHANLVEGWNQLDQAVLSGAPVRDRSSFGDREQRDNFLRGMRNLALLIAPQLVAAIDLGGRRRLLDLGGGPGTYALQFCEHNPQLKAVIFDLPTSRDVAEETIERFAMAGRVSFQAGDFLSDPLPAGCDVAWLSHILHGEGPQQCRQLIAKTVDVLEPGGLLLVHEFLLDEGRDGPPFPALFSLNMLVGTEHGRSYTGQEVAAMLEEAGLQDIHRLPVATPNDSGVISGTAPA